MNIKLDGDEQLDRELEALSPEIAPPRDLWPEMDYSVLPELAAYPARFNAAAERLDKQAAAGYADKPMF